MASKNETSSESSESLSDSGSEEVGAGTTIDVCTFSKGRVYERTEAAKKMKIFSGSGVASFEKARVTIPSKVAKHEYGVHWMVKNLLARKMANSGKPSMDVLNF